MTKFAVCDWSDVVWQIDTGQPGLLPYPVHSGNGNGRSLAYTDDHQLVMVAGASDHTIKKTTGPYSQELLYTEPMPKVYLSKVRVRLISPGEERIYFSSYDASQGAEYIGEQIFQIRYLKNEIAMPYTTIYPSQLTIPDPCNPGGYMAAYMSGDFAFGDNDTLYLATGQLAGGNNIKLKCGIYQVNGAGPDQVTGTVKRIYLGDGPISGLCYRSPKTLYFLRSNEICRLDLTTMTETFLCSIPQQAGYWGAIDLTWVENGFPQAYWWHLLSSLYLLLKLPSAFVWKMAMAFVLGRVPEPPARRVSDQAESS